MTFEGKSCSRMTGIRFGGLVTGCRLYQAVFPVGAMADQLHSGNRDHRSIQAAVKRDR